METRPIIVANQRPVLRSLKTPNKTAEDSHVADGYAGSAVGHAEKLVLPPTIEPTPKDLTRGYLWRAIPLPGPIDALVGAAIGVGPVPRWLGLEPAPKGKPAPKPLGFGWNASSQAEFSSQAKDLESRLRDPGAKEVGKRQLRGGSNDNYLVTLSTGVSAIWTPKAGEKPLEQSRPNIPEGTQAAREEAAYIVDRRLGHLARVPPAVSSGLEGRPGALKLLVSQGNDAAQVRQEDLPQKLDPSDYRRIALFDHIVGNLDRHSGNFLVDENQRPIPIDQGLSFPTKNGAQGHQNFKFDATFALNKKERAMLTKFSAERKSVQGELSGLLEPSAIDAMYERVDRMLELGWVSHEWRSG